MAASNDVVAAAQFPIVACVYAAIALMCLFTFRSVGGTLCVVIPLALVSLLAYALMAALGIGLKVNTLPVAALGAGIGVDYGIYLWSRVRTELALGAALPAAYLKALRVTGRGVLFTGLTLATGVATWSFSDLKFQADMGILLSFLFLVNMFGALTLLPALASWLLPRRGGLA
ncbi:MAG: MMPL family transporter [Dehalococcoidia bacterium]